MNVQDDSFIEQRVSEEKWAKELIYEFLRKVVKRTLFVSKELLLNREVFYCKESIFLYNETKIVRDNE